MPMVVDLFDAADKFWNDLTPDAEQLTLRQDVDVVTIEGGCDQDIEKIAEGHAMTDAHPLHGHGGLFNFNHFVVVSGNQSVEWIANKAETEMAVAIFACFSQRDEFSFIVGFGLPELVRCGFRPFGRAFREKPA